MKRLIWILISALALFTGCKKDDAKSTASLTTADASAVAVNSATSGGDVTGDGGSGISKRGVCYATHPAPTVSDSVTVDGASTGTFTSSMEGLYSYTKYYVRAYAINASGTAYGNEINFTTAVGVPSVSTTTISNIVPLKASGGGTVLSDGGSPVTARGIVWSLTVHPTIDNFKTVDGSGVGTFTDSLSPLGSQKTYYVRAYATNGTGTGYGNELTFTSSSADVVTDIDGNVYGYVTVGTQTWMTSNLKVAHYRNGDPINDGYENHSSWYVDNWNVNLTISTGGAFTYPNDSTGTNDYYGKLYDNMVIGDARGICPYGWHVPTDEEWQTLEVFEGMSVTDAASPHLPEQDGDVNPRGNIGSKLIEGGVSGLNFRLAGTFSASNRSYSEFKNSGLYWTATSPGNLGIAPISLCYWFRQFNPSGASGPIYRTYVYGNGYSVRCIKDN